MDISADAANGIPGRDAGAADTDADMLNRTPAVAKTERPKRDNIVNAPVCGV